MRIAFFTETYFPQLNGVTYTLDAWCRELRRRGHEVTVVYPESDHAPGPGERPAASLAFPPVEGYRIGLSSARRLHRELPPVDVVHTHGPFTLGLTAHRFAEARDVPLFATHHTPGEKYIGYVTERNSARNLLSRVYARWEGFFYRRCHRILAPTPEAAGALSERTGRDVLSFSNGTDTSFFTPRPSRFRERHGLGPGPLIGSCGRLGYEKNLEDLIELARVFDGTVVMAGEGFAAHHYVPLFEEAGVRYLGRLPRWEMPEYYSALDVFIMPSKEETQGVSVLEANACGTPAVGADAMGLRDTIQEGRNGYRYPPGDVEAFHERVLKTLAERDDLAAGARAFAEGHSVSAVVDRLLDLYRDVRTSAGLPPESLASAKPPMTRLPP